MLFTNVAALLVLFAGFAHSDPIPWADYVKSISGKGLLPNHLNLLKNIFGPKPDDPAHLHTWCSNYRYSTAVVEYPQSVDEVQRIVRSAKKVRVLGARHSSSRIADTSDTLISLLAQRQIVSFDPAVPSITVQAGIHYTDLAPYLQHLGYGLPNLASLGEITVGGAAQTGAHGSGRNNKVLASQIRSMDLVLANGSLAHFGPGDERLKAAAVGVGALGVLTQVELNLVPTFNTTHHVFLNMPMDQFYEHFDEIEQLGYSVQMFTNFSTPGVWDQIWINVLSDSNSSVASMETLYGAQKAKGPVSPVPAFLLPNFITEQGVEQPWYYGLVDYRLGLSGTDGAEIETEYFLPYENAVPAIKACANISGEVAPVLLYFLVRTAKADDLWMSESYGQDTVIINLTFFPGTAGVANAIRLIEKTLIPFGARPHWGKVFEMGPEHFLKAHYPKLQDFRKLAKQLDPRGKFRNPFLDRNVFSDHAGPNPLDQLLTNAN